MRGITLIMFAFVAVAAAGGCTCAREKAPARPAIPNPDIPAAEKTARFGEEPHVSIEAVSQDGQSSQTSVYDAVGNLIREEIDWGESGFEWRYLDAEGKTVRAEFDFGAKNARDGRINQIIYPQEDGSEIEERDTDLDGKLDTRIYKNASKFEIKREKME